MHGELKRKAFFVVKMLNSSNEITEVLCALTQQYLRYCISSFGYFSKFVKNFVKKICQRIRQINSSTNLLKYSSNKSVKKFVKKFVKKNRQKPSSKICQKLHYRYQVCIHTSRRLKKALLQKKSKSQTNKQTNTTWFLEALLADGTLKNTSQFLRYFS